MRHYSHQSHCSLQEAWGAFRLPSDSDLLEEADVEGWVPSCVGVSWGHWEGGEEEASDFAVGSPLRYVGSRPCVGVEVCVRGGFFCRKENSSLPILDLNGHRQESL